MPWSVFFKPQFVVERFARVRQWIIMHRNPGNFRWRIIIHRNPNTCESGVLGRLKGRDGAEIIHRNRKRPDKTYNNFQESISSIIKIEEVKNQKLGSHKPRASSIIKTKHAHKQTLGTHKTTISSITKNRKSQ